MAILYFCGITLISPIKIHLNTMSFALNRNKASFILFTILFRVLLEISYFSVVSEVYAYEGFLKNFDYANYLLSWIIFLVLKLIKYFPNFMFFLNSIFFFRNFKLITSNNLSKSIGRFLSSI